MNTKLIHATRLLVAVLAGAWLVTACASAPETREEQQTLEAQADATLQGMVARDPSLRDVLDDAVGYVVFPEIGKGGAVVGGAQGVGVVYEDGMPIGTAALNQATIGAQLGGQTFSELIVFSEREPLERLKAGNFDLTADASATAITSGAAAQASFENGTAVFISGEEGLMAEASVGGQEISFEPMA
jgi:lipid-binding SYLF domain-containing protein